LSLRLTTDHGRLTNRALGIEFWTSGCSSFDFLRLLLFQNLVDSLVENRAVTVDVHALRIRFSFYQIKPTFAIRVFVHDRDPLFHEWIGASEVPFRDAEQVGNGFESFDPPDDLSRLDRRTRFDFKSVVHHVAQHPHGELGEPDAPQIALLPRNPAMRGAVKIVHRQLGHEARAFVVERFRYPG